MKDKRKLRQTKGGQGKAKRGSILGGTSLDRQAGRRTGRGVARLHRRPWLVVHRLFTRNSYCRGAKSAKIQIGHRHDQHEALRGRLRVAQGEGEGGGQGDTVIRRGRCRNEIIDENTRAGKSATERG